MSNKEGSTSNAAEGEIKLTPLDSKFFAVFFKNLPKNVDIDWEKFAAEMGFKNTTVAKTRYGQIRAKLGISGAGHAPPLPAKPAVPRTPANANKVIKPRKPTKPKQPKHVLERADDADDDEKAAADAQEGEI